MGQNNKKCPMVSVVMPVYNTEEYLKESIVSILGQTLEDFEFIIIDDSSTDHSPEIVRSFKDERIVFVSNQRNIGNYPSRNIGIRMARGKYIAVMDSDDVALPERLRKQYDFMEEHPEVGVVGSQVKFSSGGVWYCSYPLKMIKIRLLESNCMCHPSMFVRKELFCKYDLFYNEYFCYSADYEFLTRAVDYAQIFVLPEILLIYRCHDKQISCAKFEEQTRYADQIRLNYIKKCGVQFTKKEEDCFCQLFTRLDTKNSIPLQSCIALLEKIIGINKIFNYFEKEQLVTFLTRRLYYKIVSDNCHLDNN